MHRLRHNAALTLGNELAVQEHILWTVEYGLRLSHRSIAGDMAQLTTLQAVDADVEQRERYILATNIEAKRGMLAVELNCFRLINRVYQQRMLELLPLLEPRKASPLYLRTVLK